MSQGIVHTYCLVKLFIYIIIKIIVTYEQKYFLCKKYKRQGSNIIIGIKQKLVNINLINVYYFVIKAGRLPSYKILPSKNHSFLFNFSNEVEKIHKTNCAIIVSDLIKVIKI